VLIQRSSHSTPYPLTKILQICLSPTLNCFIGGIKGVDRCSWLPFVDAFLLLKASEDLDFDHRDDLAFRHLHIDRDGATSSTSNGITVRMYDHRARDNSTPPIPPKHWYSLLWSREECCDSENRSTQIRSLNRENPASFATYFVSQRKFGCLRFRDLEVAEEPSTFAYSSFATVSLLFLSFSFCSARHF
jgi:hypothetical protein